MRSVIWIASLATLAFVPAMALAHKMELLAEANETELRVIAGYEGDEPALDATVTLTDAAGVEVARGTTNENGLCVLPRPKAGTYQIVADDGAGHREEIPITLPESTAEITARTERRNRWLMAAIGLAAIGGGTAIARLLRRRTG